MTEAPGLAPEEVESLVTFPIETKLSGATGVQAVRTSSAVGISVAYVEFDWGTDIYNDRQIVAERLALAKEQLPKGVNPQLAPISSIMGQVVVAGMYSQVDADSMLFKFAATGEELASLVSGLDIETSAGELRDEFAARGFLLKEGAGVNVERLGSRWSVLEGVGDRSLTMVRVSDGIEIHRTTPPMELRTLADWVVRQQLLAIPGVSQVFVMGGQRKQFQVLINPELLLRYGVTLEEARLALGQSNENATGGYLDEQGPSEFLVRVLGRVTSVQELNEVVVKHREGRSILLGQIARIIEGPQVQRGDSTAYVRSDEGTFAGGPAVVLTINKQPGADTRKVTDEITRVLADLQSRLPPDIRIAPRSVSAKIIHRSCD